MPDDDMVIGDFDDRDITTEISPKCLMSGVWKGALKIVAKTSDRLSGDATTQKINRGFIVHSAVKCITASRTR